MTGNAVSAKANIEVKKLEHCNQISPAQKSAMVVPLCNVIGKANGNEQEPLQYILSHPEWLEAVQLRTDKLLHQENPQNPLATILKLMQPTPLPPKQVPV